MEAIKWVGFKDSFNRITYQDFIGICQFFLSTTKVVWISDVLIEIKLYQHEPVFLTTTCDSTIDKALHDLNLTRRIKTCDTPTDISEKEFADAQFIEVKVIRENNIGKLIENITSLEFKKSRPHALLCCVGGNPGLVDRLAHELQKRKISKISSLKSLCIKRSLAKEKAYAIL
mgnify:CR=1 FL=1